MKRALISIVAAILLVAVSASAQSVVFKGTLDEAFAKAKTEGKLVLLDFSSYT